MDKFKNKRPVEMAIIRVEAVIFFKKVVLLIRLISPLRANLHRALHHNALVWMADEPKNCSNIAGRFNLLLLYYDFDDLAQMIR